MRGRLYPWLLPTSLPSLMTKAQHFTGSQVILLFLRFPTLEFIFNIFLLFPENSYFFLRFPTFLLMINHTLGRECKNVMIFMLAYE